MRVAARFLLLLSTIIIALPLPAVCGEIIHYFDQDGSVWHGRQTGLPPRGTPAPSSRRYAVPEGVVLRPDVTYDQYPVFGNNISEIMQSIGENGPLSRSGDRRIPSDTVWSLSLSYRFLIAPELDEDTGIVHIIVSVSDLSVDYRITVTIPALINEATLDPVERSLWKRYLGRLLEYEHGRIRVIRDADLRSALFREIADLNYLSLPYHAGLDLEEIVGVSLREETERLGKEWAIELRRRHDKFEREMSRGGIIGTGSLRQENSIRP